MSVGFHSEASHEVPGKVMSGASRLLSAIARHLDWIAAIALIVITTTLPEFLLSGSSISMSHPSLLVCRFQSFFTIATDRAASILCAAGRMPPMRGQGILKQLAIQDTS